MKKATLILASISFMILASCNDKKETTEKTVIIEKEAAPAVEEESDGTSLSISDDGVEFSTKDGENKTEIEIDTDKK